MPYNGQILHFYRCRNPHEKENLALLTIVAMEEMRSVEGYYTSLNNFVKMLL